MNRRKKTPIIIRFSPVMAILLLLPSFTVNLMAQKEDLKSKYSYKDFESAKKCRSCHPGIYEQWTQAMMSQAYTHHWNEIEYFDLAVAHAKAKPDFNEAVSFVPQSFAGISTMKRILLEFG